MKRFNLDKDYLKLSFYILMVIIGAILFEKVISNLSNISDAASELFKSAGRVMSPFLYAFFISFFLNPFARWLQNNIFSSDKLKPKAVRVISSMLALVVFISLIVIISAFILPELVASLFSLAQSLPEIIRSAQQEFGLFLEHNSEKYGLFSPEQFMEAVEPFFSGFGTFADIMYKVVRSGMSFGRGIFNFLIGLIIAFYMLIYKDGFKSYWTKLIYAVFKPERAELIIHNCGRINRVYEGFFVGKTLDSAIIGVLSFIIMSVAIKPGYILLSAVVIGVTNMIPFFGPFIGAVPVVLLNLFSGNIKLAIIMAIFIFLLQQFDGYILGPKILGDSTGLSPFWVIASILIGGALWGFAGMLLGVPTFAVIKMFADEAVEKRFVEKYGRERGK